MVHEIKPGDRRTYKITASYLGGRTYSEAFKLTFRVNLWLWNSKNRIKSYNNKFKR